MLARHRYANTRYFYQWVGGGATSHTAHSIPAPWPPMEESLHHLTKVGYLTEIVTDGFWFNVACRPARFNQLPEGQELTLLYKGVSLPSILATAAFDARQLLIPLQPLLSGPAARTRIVP
jgi:hypothetical protein